MTQLVRVERSKTDPLAQSVVHSQDLGALLFCPNIVFKDFDAHSRAT
jgi:hypothetical protein